jgi:predicted DCC family thiol-disulfide oxidoreductase YuxK
MIRMANEHPIVLFDGVCNLCNRSVQFIIQHDPQGRFRFASLQSELGAELRARLGIDPQAIDSIILIEGDRWYRESAAALRIARGLSGAWKMLWPLRFVPRSLRDGAYRIIARNRYRWFGKQETCWLPTPELRGRFLG